MTRIDLDADAWRTRADFYAALLPVIGAADWVGGNLDALFDAFAGNASRLPPYEIVVHGAANMAAEELAYIRRAEAVFADARLAFGQQVYLRIA